MIEIGVYSNQTVIEPHAMLLHLYLDWVKFGTTEFVKFFSIWNNSSLIS